MIDFFSEEFSPHGGITSEGALNPLGRPALNPITVLVREAVQNCWDARLDGEQVEVTFELRHPDDAARSAFEQLAAADVANRTGLSRLAGAGEVLQFLTISDRGTSGLGGPLRANLVEPGARNSFVDFLRNIGQPPDREHSGGTYGFGKAALYRASQCQAILVYSRTRHGGGLQSRFMGAALSGQFNDGLRRFTGRHWWGHRAEDGVLDPLLDADADECALALGMPVFESTQTGTSILIVQPELSDRTPEEFLGFVRTALLWHFWPKMVDLPDGGEAPMAFTLRLDQTEMAHPDPEQFPPLHGFVRALRDLRDPSFSPDGIESQLSEIQSFRPARHLGRLVLRNFIRHDRALDEIGDRDDALDLDQPSAHVALLRTPELVVEYVAGPPLGSEHVEYAGVFRADDELDALYASAEPPTHDHWEPEAVTDRTGRTHIRNTYRRIAEALQAFAAPRQTPAATVSGRSLAGVAGQLGELLPGIDGTGGRRAAGGVTIDRRRTEGPTGDQTPDQGGAADRDSGSAPDAGGSASQGTRRRASAELIGTPQLISDSGRRLLAIRFSVTHAGGSAGTWVSAAPRVVLEAGDRETEAPLGADEPTVVAWELVDGRRLEGMEECFFDLSVAGDARVLVAIPADAEIAVELNVRDEAP